MKIKRTICFISYYMVTPYINGIGKVCANLTDELRARGYKLIFIYAEKSTIDLYNVDDTYLLPYNLWDNKNIDYLKTLLLENNVDIIIDVSCSERVHDLTNLARKSLSCKLVSVSHVNPLAPVRSIIDDYAEKKINKNSFKYVVLSVGQFLKYPFAYLIRMARLIKKHKKYYFESDSYIFLCEEDAAQVRRLINKDDYRKIRAINNPIVQQESEIKSKSNYVVFVGRVEFQKRIDRLLRIWKYVEKYIYDHSLIIVGGGSKEDYFNYYAKELSLKNVNFVGYQKSGDYIRKAKVLVVTSTHEAFPMVLLEAQQNACVPILFDSFNSAHLIVKNGIDGYLINPFDEKSFAKRIVSILKNDDQLKMMQQNALKSVIKFNVREIVNNWEVLFDDLYLV